MGIWKSVFKPNPFPGILFSFTFATFDPNDDFKT